MAYWIDNADSYICSACGYECNNPNKLQNGPGRCPICNTIMYVEPERKIGFVFAMEEEAEPYKELLKGNNNVVIAVSGVGRTNAALTTVELISKGVYLIINIGTCGSTIQSKNTWFAPNKFYDGDFDLSAFGKHTKDPLGVNSEDDFTDVIPIYTYSHFVQDAEPNRLIDMESYDIVAVCRHFNIPCLVYKVVSDNADSNSHENFDNVANDVSKRTAEEILEDVKVRLGGMDETYII